ncbi:arginase family protein [Enterobacter sp. CC120223-11]|uniref:arginase family protein n=1 Tax=Enterobacter sp. CC120223-11 TaxID=1378073 RepID=UPI000BC6390C|nr:arginase family protein [Enterobacter sp. CC120223-11]SNY59207.1 arginase [Enterobacter sp. CC120223-11]
MHLILAPCNLGLRPLYPGHVPGTLRAPEVLMAQGLAERLHADSVTWLPVTEYSPDAQAGTRLYNGHALREFNLMLAEEVARTQARQAFPLVIGGDCSVLLGALAGSRATGPVSLVHIDGHSDFRHPGNYDPQQKVGAVAGMDLALATGRGEVLLTRWPGIAEPLVQDEHAIQIGERESRDANFAWPDIAQSGITCLDVFTAQQMGTGMIKQAIAQVLHSQPGQRYWVHFDVDVLDQAVMPAVDSPGSPGIDRRWLEEICASLLACPLCCGMTVTVFDPDLDHDGRCAALIIGILENMFQR